MELEKERLIWFFRKMLEIRHFELKAAELYAQAIIPGPVHLYIGEEAVAAGVCASLRKDDYACSTHRGHGHFIARDAQLDRTMAELLGKEGGYNKGNSGSMHLSRVEEGDIHLSTSIVGAGIPIAAGLGLAIKLNGTDQVAACFFGDGASNQGTFHEGINIASIWGLPVVFVCENNRYAVHTSISYSTKIRNIAGRSEGYGIPGVTVDGKDVMAVYKASSKAIKRAREGKGPTLLECVMDRWRPHNEGKAEHRHPKELEAMKRTCPIERFRLRLIETNVLTGSEADKIESEVLKAVEDAVRFAKNSGYPAPEDALRYVYA